MAVAQTLVQDSVEQARVTVWRSISMQLSYPGMDKGDGWFDLGLRGSDRQLSGGLIYLDSQSVEVWSQTRGSEEGKQ